MEVIRMKVSVSRKGNEVQIDIWDENLTSRSITLTVKEVRDEDREGLECELVVGSAIISADDESVVVKNKFGDEVITYLFD
jgi:hypothetical protein